MYHKIYYCKYVKTGNDLDKTKKMIKSNNNPMTEILSCFKNELF